MNDANEVVSIFTEETFPDAASGLPLVLLIEARPLLRQLLQGFLESSNLMRVVSSPSIKEWLRSEQGAQPSEQGAQPAVILLSIPDGGRLPGSLSELMIPANNPLASAPVVVQSNDRPGHQVLGMLKIGVQGFIPSSVSMDVAVHALRLVCVGGTFVPSSCLQSLPEHGQGDTDGAGFLTGRQLQVAEAIRQGKPNKIIAYELNMCESTVKVHVRAIMKKLKARNRTEVAYIYSSGVGDANGAASH